MGIVATTQDYYQLTYCENVFESTNVNEDTYQCST